MAGSSFGKIFRITTWGESHGPALGCVIDGCPAGVELSEADIQPFLDRRKPGNPAVATARKESDTCEILSGVFEGKTTGIRISIPVITIISKTFTDPVMLITHLMPSTVSEITEAAEDHPEGKRPQGLSPVL